MGAEDEGAEEVVAGVRSWISYQMSAFTSKWNLRARGGPLFCLFVEAEVNRLDGFFSFLFAMLLDEDDNDNSPPVPFLSRPLQQINTNAHKRARENSGGRGRVGGGYLDFGMPE